MGSVPVLASFARDSGSFGAGGFGTLIIGDETLLGIFGRAECEHGGDGHLLMRWQQE